MTALHIENFVLIENLDLAFEPGICLLTGETGAGKSILIDAVAAALGGRIGLDAIRTGAGRARIEATFALPVLPPGLGTLLEAEGIEQSVAGEITLTREISPKGTRCRLDGRLVSQQVLRRAGRTLVDILSQHEHQALLDGAYHQALLDQFGGLTGLCREVERAHETWSQLATERRTLREGARQRARELDFWRFQLAELADAQLKGADEAEILGAERRQLLHADQLRATCAGAYEAVYAGENGPSLYDRLGKVITSLTDLAHLDATLGACGEALAGLQGGIHDVSDQLRRHLDALEADPARLALIEERLDLLATLSRKYGPGLGRVIALAQELESKVAEGAREDERIVSLKPAVADALAHLTTVAARLSARRQDAARHLVMAVESQLAGLELPDARFRVALTPPETPAAPRATGAEAVEFEVALNPGEPPRSLARTASGGELARLMLALKTVLAFESDVPTLIFDEVDAGLSGRAAQAVAEKLAGLGTRYQILCITHLPTVAAMADQHLHLEKRVVDGRTHVHATVLDPAGRIAELAHIASGRSAPAAQRHASELLERAAIFKKNVGKSKTAAASRQRK